MANCFIVGSSGCCQVYILLLLGTRICRMDAADLAARYGSVLVHAVLAAQ
jgi:hypothetical protein